MFQGLTERFTGVFDNLRRRGTLNEADVDTALREVRVALLEADVALSVVKSFVQSVRERAVGEGVLASLTPAQTMVKIVHDALVDLLTPPEGTGELSLNVTPPAVFLMVGLQGSGKTTTTAKLAHFLKEKQRKKVLMASLDVARAAAREQLEALGKGIEVATLPIQKDDSPQAIVKRAIHEAKLGGYDILLLDTAGRLQIDEALMDELESVKALIPEVAETLLVVDAMMGQESVNVARAFHEKVNLSGVVLSRIDGDARGGAALSVLSVTGCPIKFLGIGEHPQDLESFDADRLARRILGMGDVLGLVEKISSSVDDEDARRSAQRFEKGLFTLNDMDEQIKKMLGMGGMGAVLNLLPGMGKMKDKLPSHFSDERLMKRQRAIISSMTPQERGRPALLNASRKRRIAKGSGTQVQDVNRLLKAYEGMVTMMKRMKGGKMGALKEMLQHGANPFKR